MSTPPIVAAALRASALVLLAACSVKRIQEEPILENGDRVPTADRPPSPVARTENAAASVRMFDLL